MVREFRNQYNPKRQILFIPASIFFSLKEIRDESVNNNLVSHILYGLCPHPHPQRSPHLASRLNILMTPQLLG